MFKRELGTGGGGGGGSLFAFMIQIWSLHITFNTQFTSIMQLCLHLNLTFHMIHNHILLTPSSL